MTGESSVLFMVGVMLISLFILLTFNLVMYVIRGYALSVLAKNNGFEEKSIYGYVPFLSDYFVHELATGTKDMSKNTVGVVTMVTGIISFFTGGIASLLYIGSYLYACNELFKKINPEKYEMHSVINIISLGIYSYIYLFINRNVILDYNMGTPTDKDNDIDIEYLVDETGKEIRYVNLSK